MLRKKAFMSFILAFGVLFLIASLIVAFSLPKVNVQDYIGLKQYSILQGNEEVEVAQQYIDLSTMYSALAAKDLFLERGGVYYQLGDDDLSSFSRCGSYIYEAYKTKDKNCVPDFASVYRNYFSDEFRLYISQYKESPLFFTYDLGFESSDDQTKISLSSTNPVRYSLQSFSSRVGYRQSSIFGGYGSEKSISCASGFCVRDAALHLYNLYSNNGQELLPYVWGGESPYSYEDTIALQSLDDSIFEGVSVTRLQPDRSAFTEAGFDCSGWTWWVGNHTGIDAFTVRRSADEYYRNATVDGATLICGENTPCLFPVIVERAEPGDIFYHSSDGFVVGHMGIYLGDGKIIHSKGGVGLVIDDLATTYAFEDETDILAIYRYSYEDSGLDVFPSSDVVNLQPGLLEPDQREALIVELAADLEIEPAVALAVFEVETGGKAGLCENGKPLIRFEPHIFCKESGNEASWCKNANTNDQMRKNFFDEGFSHGSNCRTNGVEWESLAHAKELNEDAAYRSISTGVAQIMGFNHQVVGYTTAKAMHDAYAISEEAQIRGFFSFVENYNSVRANGLSLIETARVKDFPAFAQIYNGQHMSCKNPIYRTTCYKDLLLDAYDDFSSQQLSTLPFSTRSSYIEFSPRVETVVDFDLSAFTDVTSIFLSSLDRCKDDLPGCVDNAVKTYNGETPTNFVELPEDNESFALDLFIDKKIDFAKTNPGLDLVEQILDCSFHEYDSCYCQIDIDTSSDYEIVIDGKRAFYNDKEFLGLSQRTYVNGVIEPVEISVDDGEISFTGGNYDFVVEDDIVGITLNKTKDNMSWIPLYNTDRQLLCPDPKNYYRFDAFIDEIGNPLQFSYYVEDTVAPKPVDFSAKQKICTNDVNAILLSWSVPKSTERLYAFDIVFEEDSSTQATSHRVLAEVFDGTVPGDISILNKLYREEGESSYNYYFLIDDARAISEFEAGQSYYYKVIAYDQYGNVDSNIDFKTYSFQDRPLDVLSQLSGVNLGSLEFFVSEAFNYGACAEEETSNGGSLFDDILDFFS